MRLGKVKESVLKRSVLRQLHTQSPSGSPRYGEDAGLLSLEDLFRDKNDGSADASSEQNQKFRLVAVSVNPVEGWTLAARRAVYGAINSLTAANAVPVGIAPVILMPGETQEPQLKGLMREIDDLCQQEALYCLAGHTAVSPYVNTLILSVSAIGKKEAPCAENPIRPDMDIVVAGTVGREGTALLAIEREEELCTRYPAFFIEEAKHLFDDASMKTAADCARRSGASYIHDVREGGIFAGLWELAAAGQVGLCVELKEIPIRQHTIEVCEYFRLNPYMLRSGGALLLVGENGERIAAALRQEGISAAVVGRTTGGNDKIIRYDDEVRYLEPPKQDEYYVNGGNYA